MPRLPDGGGRTIAGFYNVVPSKFSVPANNFVTLSDSYGKQIQHWNGVDVNVNLRARDGVFVQGGTSTGPHVHRQLRGRRATARSSTLSERPTVIRTRTG